MRYMVQDFFLGGAWASNMKLSDYRVGFQTPIADKINNQCVGQPFDQGDCYIVTRNVTPVFNDNFGHIQIQKIDISTGATGLDNIGKIKFING